MGAEQQSLDLRSLLGAVEEASPVDAADVLGAELARALDASHVALLIASFSGDALMRVSHVENTGLEPDGRNERAQSIPLAGTVHEQVLFTQHARVAERERDWLVLVPITERGDAIGLLEASFAERPTPVVVDHVAVAAHAWPTS